jgi:manganese transport protein
VTDTPDKPFTSLGEVHASVAVPRHPSFWRRLLAFIGPAYLISVGYMDPGNWATDIAAGSRFGSALLWVLVMSNLMAMLLQGLSARLGIVSGMDLAQACRALYGRPVAVVLWLLAELAIAATDLAEVLGTAIGLNLLFGVPLIVGVVLTTLDTMLLLLLHSLGMRVMEAFVVVLITTIAACLGVEIFLSRPDVSSIIAGLRPSLPGDGALYLAIGIVGATVMPHNLYLHSALVQSRRIAPTPAGIRSGIRFNTIDSVVALSVAFFINAALLIVAASTFYRAGHHQVAEIQDAYHLLTPILGVKLAPVAFAVALIASGQSSAITGTLAGQIVMEGFIQLRLRPIVRRLLTRAVAIVPAVVAILVLGDGACGELLVLSQVILSLQLSFAVIPLIHLTVDRRWMGAFSIGRGTQLLSWLVALIIVGLNLALSAETVSSWARSAGDHGLWVWIGAGVGGVGVGGLLLYVSVVPILQRRRGDPAPAQLSLHGPPTMLAIDPAPLPQQIAVALDFSGADRAVLAHTLAMARAAGRGARVVLLHVVESTGAHVMGAEMHDVEAKSDRDRLELYCTELIELGVEASCDLGFGNPADALAALVQQHRPELLVMGGHGHGVLGDILHGTTVERLRHQVLVPVLVVPTRD